MANTWHNIDMIAAESLSHMEDALVLSNLVSRDKTSDFNTKPNGYAVGDTVRIKQYGDFTVNDFTPGTPITIQDIRASQRDFTIERHLDVSIELNAKELALNFDGFSDEVLKPALYRLAVEIDEHVGTKVLEGTGLYRSDDMYATAADMALSRKAANNQQLDVQGRFCLVNDTLEAELLGATYFNQYNARGEEGQTVFQEAKLGRAMGMNFYASLQLPVDAHTPGSGVGVTNNTGTTNLIGLSVLTTDSSTGQFEPGDRIVVAGVRRPLVVSTQLAATGTSILLTEPIDQIIPDGAAITTIGSGGAAGNYVGSILDSNAIALAMPLLDKPSNAISSVVSSNGFSLRLVQAYDIQLKKEVLSIDCLLGAKAYDARRIVNLREF
jgi:hypothetical protein